MSGDAPQSLTLDGSSLSIADLARIARDPRVEVKLDGAALAAVQRGWQQILAIVEEYRAAWNAGRNAPGVYGVTTGFGEFKKQRITPDALERVQRNLLLSHAVGAGDNADADDPANYFPAEIVRATLALRVNTFLKGHSGVRAELVECVRRMLNAGIVPLVPTRGSLGSSGDLCPLAHLFCVLLGEGRYYVVRSTDDMRAGPRELRDARGRLARDLGYDELPVPKYKEGIALSNGATFSAAILALAVHDAERLASTCDIAAAMTLEAVCGRTRALDPKIHAARGMTGQIDSAANLRMLVAGSRLVDRADDVQDAYSVRCAPQVHGAARDAIAYAKMVVEREINAATDNPLFFPDSGPPWDVEQFFANRPESFGDAHAYSAGNFHGEPLALAADALAIALAELANISERRTQLLLDQNHNRGLPANLIARRGLNSGLMIAQYTAAGLVSENKVLAHPASVDSIPASANSEDHNSMATIAARKLRAVLANAQAVLAIELLVGAQAIEWRVGMNIDPNRPAEGGRATGSAAADEQAGFAAAVSPTGRQRIAAELGRGTRTAYLAVRRAAEPLLADRVLEPDVRGVRRLIETGEFPRCVCAAIPGGLRPLAPLQPAAPA
jgi:histidine ammonia-lyase